MKPGHVSKVDYARHRGCAPSAVTRAIKEGRISVLPDGSINPRIADVEWAENSRARADSQRHPPATPPAAAAAAATPPAAAQPAPADAPGAPPPPPAEGGYADHRARREKAEAEEAELRVARLAGRLLDKSAVEPAVFDVVRAMRDRVMNVPARAAPEVIGLVEVRQVQLLLEEHLRKAFGAVEEQVLDSLRARAGT